MASDPLDAFSRRSVPDDWNAALRRVVEGLKPHSLLDTVQQMRDAGWMVVEPGHVPIPRTLAEAKAMFVLSKDYIEAEAFRAARQRMKDQGT